MMRRFIWSLGLPVLVIGTWLMAPTPASAGIIGLAVLARALNSFDNGYYGPYYWDGYYGAPYYGDGYYAGPYWGGGRYWNGYYAGPYWDGYYGGRYWDGYGWRPATRGYNA